MNRFSHIFLVCIVVGTFVATNALAQDPTTPKGWKRVTACSFSFLLPEKAREVTGRPIDSCIAEFRYKDVNVYLDYGLYSAPPSEQASMKNYENRSVTINGSDARLITYDDWTHSKKVLSFTALHIVTAKATPPILNNVSLLMVITAKPSGDRQIVKRIYESLKYLGK